jgi:hypothetical protein
MLCLQVYRSIDPQDNEYFTEQVYNNLCSQLPQGLELLSVNVVEAKTSFQPCSAKYVLAVRREYLNEQLKATIKRLLASDSIKIQRQTTKTKSRISNRESKVKNIDVRGFFESIELAPEGIIVECKVTPAGSIRVEEILKLLDLDDEKLALPVRRASVQWKNN